MEENKTELKGTDSGTEVKPEDILKKQLFWSRVTGICSIFGAVCILILMAAALSFVPAVTDIMTNFEEVSAELKDMSTEITKVLRSLNDQGLNEIYGTLNNIQQIDINKLNESIDSLYRIIDPIAELFK